MAGFAVAAAPYIISGLSALSGLFGQKSKQQQGGTINETTSSMPQYDPQAWGARNFTLDELMNRLTNRTGYLTAYTGQGLRNINQGADVRGKALQSILAARGLGGSPVGANLMAGQESGRIGEQVNFLNQIPMLNYQMQGQDLGQLASFIQGLPVGQTQTRTGTSAGTYTGTQGGGIGGGITNLSEMLAYLYGKGKIG